MKRQKTADSIENEDIVLWKCPILYKVRGYMEEIEEWENILVPTASAGRGKRRSYRGHAYKVGRFLGWYYGKQAKGDRCRVSDRKRHETLQLYV